MDTKTAKSGRASARRDGGAAGTAVGPGTMTIGQAAALSGVPPKTIRFYEQIGLIAPAARLGNRYRRYGERDVDVLRFVHRARDLGFSLKEVGELLALYRDRRRASHDVKRLALAHVADLDRKVAELTAIRDTIAHLAARCHGDQRPECPILDELVASGRAAPSTCDRGAHESAERMIRPESRRA